MNKKKVGKLIFHDPVRGIRKLYSTEKLAFFALILIFLCLEFMGLWGLYYIFYPSFSLESLSRNYPYMLLSLLGIFYFYQVIHVSHGPVRIYDQGVAYSDSIVHFISFEKIKKVEIIAVNTKKNFTKMRIIYEPKKILGVDVGPPRHNFFVKNNEQFISTLKQIYGEEKWKEIFEDNP